MPNTPTGNEDSVSKEEVIEALLNLGIKASLNPRNNRLTLVHVETANILGQLPERFTPINPETK